MSEGIRSFRTTVNVVATPVPIAKAAIVIEVRDKKKESREPFGSSPKFIIVFLNFSMLRFKKRNMSNTCRPNISL
jgi:hypothetical protein